MQATDTGTGKHIDDTINFRPSPNFIHMKKYLKSKFQEEVKRKNRVISAVQPPLPPNSPPPDSPITLKQEIEDDGYEPALSGGYSPGADNEPADALPAADAAASADAAAAADADTPLAERVGQKKFIMCKDWVRGTCSRGAACIYVHELDKSQLKGVYRFCRDFENARCERQVCYFAHATTFEKEHFYRTAELPPHALHHLKTSAPQPPAQDVAVQPELPPIFANPPPPTLASSAVVPAAAAAAAVAGGVAVAGAGALEARLPLDAFAAAAALPARPLKREWRDQADFSSPPRDLDPEPMQKKCKNCPVTTLRLQHSKAQMARALRGSQELDDKLEQLIKKNDRLQAVLKTLLKPRSVLEHVNNNFLGGNRLSALGDESDKDVLLSQMKVLLAKILLGSDAEGRENGRDLAT